MMLISHVALGSVIGKNVDNIFLASAISFFSHFLLDYFPHVQAPSDPGYRPNRKTYPIVVLDIVFVGSYLLFLYFNNLLDVKLFIVMLFAVLPDILDTTRYFKVIYSRFRFFYNFHDKIQNETTKFIGYITQVIVIGESVWMILR